MRRVAGVAALVLVVVVVAAAPLGACGGLVGENGTIQLTRTTTLAAYHDGVEHYVTSFEFSGTGAEVGSIVPLPGVPTKVERGGDWTLQRLEREVAPAGARSARSRPPPDRRRVDAEVLPRDHDRRARHHDPAGWRRRGRSVGDRPRLPPDARRARGARLLLAAQPDLHGRPLRRRTRREQLGQQSGDGTPIMLTIPTDAPWVPLRILGLGLDRSPA